MNIIYYQEVLTQSCWSVSQNGSRYLPLFLPLSLLLFLLHGGSIGLLRTGLGRSIGHVDAEYVDSVVVRCRRDKPRISTELQVVNFRLVCAPPEHKGTRGILGIHFPDSDQSALFRRRCE